MKRYKSRIASAFLVAILLLSLVPNILFAAGPPATVDITMSAVEGVRGANDEIETLTLTITTDYPLPANGLNFMDFRVNYNAQLLTVYSRGLNAAANVAAGFAEIEDGAGFINFAAGDENPDAAGWRGDVATIEFDITGAVVPGVTTFSFELVVNAAVCWWVDYPVTGIAPVTYTHTYVGALDLEITTTQAQVDALTWRVGQAIAPFTFTADNVDGPVTWTVTGLPTGITASGATLSGTPAANQVRTHAVTVRVVDDTDATNYDEATFNFVVRPAAVWSMETIFDSAAQGRQNVSVYVSNGTTTTMAGFLVVNVAAPAAEPIWMVRPLTMEEGTSRLVNTYLRVSTGAQVSAWFVATDTTVDSDLHAAAQAGRFAPSRTAPAAPVQ